MGLASFNRLRKLQAEQKKKEGVKDGNNDTRKGKKHPADKGDK